MGVRASTVDRMGRERKVGVYRVPRAVSSAAPTMDADEFRKVGHEAVEWMAHYLERGHEGAPVTSPFPPGHTLARLPPSPPERGEPLEKLFEDFQKVIVPGLTHWNDRRFFGYFPCNNSYPSVLAEMLTAAVGVNAFSWVTSPAATELELRVMDWLGQMLGLPWKGCLQDTASTGTFAALLAARERMGHANGGGVRQGGDGALTAYVSEEAHSSGLKAARMAGLGDAFVRVVPVTDDLAMDPHTLGAAMDADRAAGLRPCFVMATVGTTSTTAVDPVRAIAECCRRHGAWLHVDAALAGTAAVLPEMRWLMDGVELADSFLFNPHKWMFTNFDCSAFFVRDPAALKAALALSPEYLRGPHDGAVENLRDWGPQLGRRFRALKLWFVLRSYGVEGVRARVRLHLAMARRFASLVREDGRFALREEPRLNTVCFALDTDERTEALHRAINATGEAFVTHTRARGRYLVRASFGQTQAEDVDVDRLWSVVQAALATLPPSRGTSRSAPA